MEHELIYPLSQIFTRTRKSWDYEALCAASSRSTSSWKLRRRPSAEETWEAAVSYFREVRLAGTWLNWPARHLWRRTSDPGGPGRSLAFVMVWSRVRMSLTLPSLHSLTRWYLALQVMLVSRALVFKSENKKWGNPCLRIECKIQPPNPVDEPQVEW